MQTKKTWMNGEKWNYQENTWHLTGRNKEEKLNIQKLNLWVKLYCWNQKWVAINAWKIAQLAQIILKILMFFTIIITEITNLTLPLESFWLPALKFWSHHRNSGVIICDNKKELKYWKNAYFIHCTNFLLCSWKQIYYFNIYSHQNTIQATLYTLRHWFASNFKRWPKITWTSFGCSTKQIQLIDITTQRTIYPKQNDHSSM